MSEVLKATVKLLDKVTENSIILMEPSLSPCYLSKTGKNGLNFLHVGEKQKEQCETGSETGSEMSKAGM